MLRRAEIATNAVLDHQFAAFSTGGAEEVRKDFAEDAVLTMPEGVSKGRVAIHAASRAMFAGLFNPGTYDFALDARHGDGDRAYLRGVESPDQRRCRADYRHQ